MRSSFDITFDDICFLYVFQRKHPSVALESQKSKLPDVTDTLQKMINFVSSAKKYSSHDRCQVKITEALVKFIAGDLLPLSTVESPHFRSFLEELDPSYQIPIRKYLTKKLLRVKTSSVQTMLKKELKDAAYLALTIDLWSNRQMKSFMGITVHYLQDWKMESGMLACKMMRGSHTADNIYQHYAEVAAMFDITNKITFVVTDNAANMTRCFQLDLPGFTSVETPSDRDDQSSEDEEEPQGPLTGDEDPYEHLTQH